MAALLNKLRKARKDEETTSNQATQRSRRATKNRKKSKDPPAKAAPKPTLDGSVRQQNSIRKPKKKPSQAAPANTKLRRKLTGQNKQPSEGTDDDGRVSRDRDEGKVSRDDGKVSRDEEGPRPAPKPQPPRPPPPEQTTCSTEAIALIRVAQDLGKIEVDFDEMRTAAKEFALHAGTILAKGAIEEYMTHLRTYVPETATREHFDKNVQRNRYRDVVCCDQERVILNGPYSTTFNEYIHANHVRGQPLNPEQHFILTQGPTNATIIDFWRMVWQERSGAIVMLCDTVECSRVKCAQYWPLYDGESMKLDAIDLVVSNYGRFVHEVGLITTILNVRHLKTNTDFQVFHHQWKAWPDRGVPDKHDSVLKILQMIRSCRNGTSAIVHCSAGIGRTGTVVAVELVIQSLLQNKTPDLVAIVKLLRQKRLQSVQTDIQYAFIYKVALAFISTREPDSETSKALDDFLDSFTSMTQGMKLMEQAKGQECDHHHVQPQ